MKLMCSKPSTSSGTACLETRCTYCKYFETSASANYLPCDDPISIVSNEMRVEQATVTDRFQRLHEPRGDEVSNIGDTLTAVEYSVLVAAAVGVIAVFVAAAMGLARTVQLQTELPLAVEQ